MAQAGKPGGGVSGKPGGGLGGMSGGTGSPMTAEQAAAANGTRNQNLYTTVGGLSRPGAAARPSGPAGPPQPTPRPAIDRAPPPGGPKPRPTLDPKILDPLISGQPLTGTAGALGEGTTGFGPPGSPGVGYPEGFAPSAVTSLAHPGQDETATLDAYLRQQRGKPYKARTDLTGKSY
jgi:hypothetical protein